MLALIERTVAMRTNATPRPMYSASPSTFSLRQLAPVMITADAWNILPPVETLFSVPCNFTFYLTLLENLYRRKYWYSPCEYSQYSVQVLWTFRKGGLSMV